MNAKTAKYYLNAKNEFVIDGFNYAKPFANFFPGIAGPYGIPIWVFYVNRGQAIASFGTKDKDHAILEYFPANKSWEFTGSHGFRTFIRSSSGRRSEYYEPFHNGYSSSRYELSSQMRITPEGLCIQESNGTLGLATTVRYYTIPNDSFGALVREVTITNTSKAAKAIEVIDGLPQIIPFGTNNWLLKNMSRTIEGWMTVENLDKGVPYFKLAVDPADRPEVVHIEEGNFYLGLEMKAGANRLVTPMVDPASVFGPVTDYSQPYAFLQSKKFSPPRSEVTTSKTPSALLHLAAALKGGESKTFFGVAGYLRSSKLLAETTRKICAPGYLDGKREENAALIESLLMATHTRSSSKVFDLYCGQTYLDNLLRGGYPVTFDSGAVFYLYSRKHGDLERDYNNFQIQPSYFSQGNGNYRDVNQNRRSDTWFNPKVKDANIISFLSLIQTDGYNPLVVKGSTFHLTDAAGLSGALAGLMERKDADELLGALAKPFTPGDLVIRLENSGVKLSCTREELLDTVLKHSSKLLDAEHGEGFWTDHWTYNLDLVENYLALYPEDKASLLFGRKDITFYDNIETVKPRSEKHLLHDGVVRQLHSVAADPAKKELVKKRANFPHLMRSGHGTGEIYTTTLANKLLCLTLNKFASLDPFGRGVEMESDKPNWYDALNGLPALFGSSLNETLELLRLVRFLKGNLRSCGIQSLRVPEEIKELCAELTAAIDAYFASTAANKDYLFWDSSHSCKEAYWMKTRMGFSGNECDLPAGELDCFLEKAEQKLSGGIASAQDKKSGLYYGYFMHEAIEYEAAKQPYVQVKKFKQVPLPFFLEAQVHALKVLEPAQAAALYSRVRKSKLFDPALAMYKVTASLSSMPEEIGRCRVFAPGWLENESIWLHMEYKYLLELLRKGLYEEFYQDFRSCLIPFLNPKTYGRSILENSSFLVSSAFPDKALHGTGYVARLSGSTAEFLQMWLVMNAGPSPFSLDPAGKLQLKFSPALPGWLFDKKERSYTFNFLTTVKVTYRNPGEKDTFGSRKAAVCQIAFTDKDGKHVVLAGDTIPSPYAVQVRDRLITAIELRLK